MLYFILLVTLLPLFVLTLWKDLDMTPPAFFITVVLSLPWFFSYNEHANNIATIQEQHRVIEVYEKRVNSLHEKISHVAKGDINQALLNADTPIASMVEAITQFEVKLAKAEAKKAEAYKEITSRKLGLLSSVTWFFDDLKEE